MPLITRSTTGDPAADSARPRRFAVLAEGEEFLQMLNERIAISSALLMIEERMLAKITDLVAAVERETGGCKSRF